MFEFEGATPKQANNCQKTRINKTKSDTFIPDLPTCMLEEPHNVVLSSFI